MVVLDMVTQVYTRENLNGYYLDYWAFGIMIWMMHTQRKTPLIYHRTVAEARRRSPSLCFILVRRIPSFVGDASQLPVRVFHFLTVEHSSSCGESFAR